MSRFELEVSLNVTSSSYPHLVFKRSGRIKYMTRLPREPHHRGGQAKRNYCLICSEPTNLQSFVYLPAHNKIKLAPLCERHDNGHRIAGDEREILKGCKIKNCFVKIKCKEMCKYHYNSFYIGYPVV